jgi:MFS family permease
MARGHAPLASRSGTGPFFGDFAVLQVLASIAFLLFGYCTMILGNSLLSITVPLELRASGVSTEMTGIVMSAYFAGFLVGSRYVKVAIMRVGHIRVFAGLAALAAVATLAYPFLFAPYGWIFLRFVNGFCLVGLIAVLESWLNDRCTNTNRGGVMGIYMVAHYFAMACGQLLVNVSDIGGSAAYMLAASLLCLSLVPVVLTRTASPDVSHVEPLSLRELYAFTPLAVVGAGVGGVLMGTFNGMGAVFARSVGFSVFEVSLFTATVVVGGFLFQFPAGRLSDRFGRRAVLVGVLFAVMLASMGLVATSALADPLPASLFLAVLLGAGITIVYPTATAHAFDHIPRERFVAASSGLLAAFAIGATIGPIVASLFMGRVGSYGLFLFEGTVAGVSAAFVGYRWYQRTHGRDKGGLRPTTALET